MKKYLLIALMAAAAVSQAEAQVRFTSSDGLEFQTITDSTVTIYSGSGYEGTSLVIPSTVENEGVTYAVTEIRNTAFRNCAALLEATVPECIEVIGNRVFNGATLTTLHFNAVNCVGPTTSAINPVIVAGEALTTVTFGDKVTSIPSCFLGRTGASAKYPNLAPFTIPSSITSIGDYALNGCDFLSGELTIPANIRSVGTYAFNGDNITALKFNAVACEAFSGLYYSDDAATIQSLTIGDKVTRIPDFFIPRGSFTSVTIPDDVEYVGTGAFSGCPGLTDIKIGTNSHITYADFSGTAWHNNLSGLVYTGRYVYGIFGQIEGDIVLHDNIVNLPSFEGQDHVTALTVPQGFAAVPARMFYGCSSLKTLKWGTAIESIGDRAFYGCNSLAALQLPAQAPVAQSYDVLGLKQAGTQLILPDGAATSYKETWPWTLYYGQPGETTPFIATIVDVWGGEHTVIMTDGLTLQAGTGGVWNIVDMYTGEPVYTVGTEGAVSIVFAGGKVPDAVQNIEAESKIHFAFTPTSIIVEGLPQGTLVTAHTVDGKKLFAERATDRCIIPRSSLSRGIVIIKAGNETLKIMNR